jgi:hypothetical protein
MDQYSPSIPVKVRHPGIRAGRTCCAGGIRLENEGTMEVGSAVVEVEGGCEERPPADRAIF